MLFRLIALLVLRICPRSANPPSQIFERLIYFNDICIQRHYPLSSSCYCSLVLTDLTVVDGCRAVGDDHVAAEVLLHQVRVERVGRMGGLVGRTWGTRSNASAPSVRHSIDLRATIL